MRPVPRVHVSRANSCTLAPGGAGGAGARGRVWLAGRKSKARGGLEDRAGEAKVKPLGKRIAGNGRAIDTRLYRRDADGIHTRRTRGTTHEPRNESHDTVVTQTKSQRKKTSSAKNYNTGVFVLEQFYKSYFPRSHLYV